MGLAGDGLHRIFVRSLATATTRSVEEGIGIEIWVGNYDSVLAILVVRVI